MQFDKLKLSFYVILLWFCCYYTVTGQTNNVSPKLDLDGANENNNSNSSVPIFTGRSDGQNNRQNGGGAYNATGSGGGSGSGGGKSGPKIHGVRVTVDTGDTHKSKESKESVEIPDDGRNKKRVGIHTDITFEITADGDDDDNATNSAQRSDKEDASVPIFKGRDRSSHKPRKPYDPKTRWSPNFSSEHSRSHGYPDTAHRGGSSGRHYPQYPNYNVPVYTESGESRGGGSSIYRVAEGWNTYVPSPWTTERPFYEFYQPNDLAGHQHQHRPDQKSCYCITSLMDNRRRRQTQTQTQTHVVRPTSSIIQVVNGKLDKPITKR